MAGLAWLARKAAKRPVTVVIGDLRTGMDNFEARDAAEAAEFISRPDVRILNWYRTDKNKKGAAIAHSKVFAVEGPEGRSIAVLAGSANLTMTGLSANVETMVEAVQEDREAAFKTSCLAGASGVGRHRPAHGESAAKGEGICRSRLYAGTAVSCICPSPVRSSWTATLRQQVSNPFVGSRLFLPSVATGQKGGCSVE